MSEINGTDMTADAPWPASESIQPGEKLARGDEYENLSPVSPTDSVLDLDSYLTNMDDHVVDDDGDTTDTVFEDIWDTADTPQRDAMTPNTSSMDESPAAPDKDGECEDECDEPEPMKYHLRPQSRELKSAFMRTWIDQDETGNYGEQDPSEESRKARHRRQRVRFRLRDDYYTKANETDDDGTEDETLAKVIPKVMVTLTFQSEAGKTKYERLIRSLPSESDTECDLNSNGYRLRKRGASLGKRFYSECDLDKSRFGPDFPDDLTGHPIARGCWECLGLGIRCPLLDDERVWPCATCVADGHDCDLVTPPEFKRACERCKQKRTSCSYNYTEEHGEACQQCMDDDFRCVAGPAKDYIRVRIRYDRDWVNDPAPKQKPFKARKQPNSEEATGQRTLDDFLSRSTNEEAEQKDSSPRHGQKRRLSDEPAAAQRPTKVPRTTNKIQGTTTTIETKFCHPITFNHEESVDGGERCHFCSDPSYPIFGLAAKEVEVIEWEDGRGLEEVSGGHKGEGVENTRVCITCTTDRIPIIMCKTHELRPLGGSENDTFDVNDAFTELLSGSSKLKGKWCAICANLARYECCSAGEGRDGCGLLICEHCMVQLTGIYDGDLQKMLPELNDEVSEDRMFGLRADYELLKGDGLLMRYVLWSSQK